MNKLLSSSFKNANGIRSELPLTDNQLYSIAPSIFAAEKHDSRSERYTYIPTIDVLNGLRKEGFQPFMVAQSRSRIEGKSEYTKHMLRLRTTTSIQKAEAFEIILINSHDGTSSYQMLAGVFRFVCQNGMVAGDTVQDVRIPHRGNITENVIDAAYSIVNEFHNIDNTIEMMKQTPLSLAESTILADSALDLKYEDFKPIEARQLLNPRRREDLNNNLWSAMNNIQENLIKGGLRGFSSNGNRIRTRCVSSIDTDIRLNKSLWKLATKWVN